MRNLLMVFLVAIPAAAQEVPKAPPGGKLEWRRDLEAGLADAKRDHSPTMLYFTADPKAEAGPFSEDSVVVAARSFVAILIDCTEKSNGVRALEKRFGATGSPTVVFLDADGEALERMSGYPYLEEIEPALRRILEKVRPDLRLKRLLNGLGDSAKWVEKRVEALGDENLGSRDKATAELRQLKEAIDAMLELALRSDDTEVRARVAGILKPTRLDPVVVPVKP